MAPPLLAPDAGWTADRIRSGDPYEISHGQLIACLPARKKGSDAQAWGAAVLKSDPLVKRAGVELGVSTRPDMLRAPDVAVFPDDDSEEDGWATTAPPLAIEYAGPGQDLVDLKKKIGELLDAGTRYLWVVRLVGPRRVEVHEPGKAMVVRIAGEVLTAPGVLQNPVPVEALYNQDTAEGVVLRNLLQRYGYQDLDAVREEGLAEGKAEGKAEGRAEGQTDLLRRLLTRRFPGQEAEVAGLLAGATETQLLWLAEALLDAPDLRTLSDGLVANRG